MGNCLLATTGRTLEPDVTLKGTKLRRVTLKGGTVDVTLAVRNPNRAMGIDVTKLSYEIAKESDGTVIADGVQGDGFQIPRGGMTEVVIPVQFTYSGVGAAGKSLLRKGTVKFKISGRMDLRSTKRTRDFTHKFSAKGEFTTVKAKGQCPCCGRCECCGRR